MSKYISHSHELAVYTPPAHSNTRNRRLLGAGPSGSSRMEVVLGEIEFGGQADPHLHSEVEQAIFVMEGKAEVEIDGQAAVVGADDFIYLPAGVTHRVTALPGPPLRVLIVYAPPLSGSGFEPAGKKEPGDSPRVPIPR